MSSVAPVQYAAFISYSREDQKFAGWLQKSIEKFSVPKDVIASGVDGGTEATALKPVFLDRQDLPASSELGGSLTSALDNSRKLIVVCSESSLRSPWVNMEVQHFLQRNSREKVVCVVSESATSSAESLLPPSLIYSGKDQLLPDELLPIAADARVETEGRDFALIKVVASILEVSPTLLSQRVYKEELKRRRRLQLIGIMMAFLAVLSIILGVVALQQRNEAVSSAQEALEQRDRAEQNFKIADETANSVFTTLMAEVTESSGLDTELAFRLLSLADKLVDQTSLVEGLTTDVLFRKALGDVAFSDALDKIGKFDESRAHLDNALALIESVEFSGESELAKKIPVLMIKNAIESHQIEAGELNQLSVGTDGLIEIFETGNSDDLSPETLIYIASLYLNRAEKHHAQSEMEKYYENTSQADYLLQQGVGALSSELRDRLQVSGFSIDAFSQMVASSYGLYYEWKGDVLKAISYFEESLVFVNNTLKQRPYDLLFQSHSIFLEFKLFSQQDPEEKFKNIKKLDELEQRAISIFDANNDYFRLSMIIVELINSRGHIFLENGRYESAAVEFKRVVDRLKRIEENSAGRNTHLEEELYLAHGNLAYAHAMQGDVQSALSEFGLSLAAINIFITDNNGFSLPILTKNLRFFDTQIRSFDGMDPNSLNLQNAIAQYVEVTTRLKQKLTTDYTELILYASAQDLTARVTRANEKPEESIAASNKILSALAWVQRADYSIESYNFQLEANNRIGEIYLKLDQIDKSLLAFNAAFDLIIRYMDLGVIAEDNHNDLANQLHKIDNQGAINQDHLNTASIHLDGAGGIVEMIIREIQAKTYSKSRKFPSALVEFKKLASLAEVYIEDLTEPEEKKLMMPVLSGSYVSLSWMEILTLNPESAMQSLEQAKAAGSTSFSIEMNTAHALMMTGDINAAEELYLNNIGKTDLVSGRCWEIIVLEDFGIMQDVGIRSPLMAKLQIPLAEDSRTCANTN